MIIEDFQDPLLAQTEPELLISRRAWPLAQLLFSGPPRERVAYSLDVGWHSNVVHPEIGAVALVRPDGVGKDWVGEILRLTRWDVADQNEAYVYVLGSEGVTSDLSVTRRAFLHLGLLAFDTVHCDVDII